MNELNELAQLRAHVSGASQAPDRDTALAYIACARGRARAIAAELRGVKVTLDEIEKRVLGLKPTGQAQLVPEDA